MFFISLVSLCAYNFISLNKAYFRCSKCDFIHFSFVFFLKTMHFRGMDLRTLFMYFEWGEDSSAEMFVRLQYNTRILRINRFSLKRFACLVVISLVPRQEFAGSNPNSGIYICRGSDSTSNWAHGWFSRRMQNMTIAPVINQ